MCSDTAWHFAIFNDSHIGHEKWRNYFICQQKCEYTRTTHTVVETVDSDVADLLLSHKAMVLYKSDCNESNIKGNVVMWKHLRKKKFRVLTSNCEIQQHLRSTATGLSGMFRSVRCAVMVRTGGRGCCSLSIEELGSSDFNGAKI